jgi:serine/threonine protein kinase
MIKIGEVIGNTYVVEEKIGSGANGIIYKAYHLRLKKIVVIKQIRQELNGKINERAEVDILKDLKHNYIPQVYDFIEYDGNFYTVMEYIQGSSLANELKKRKRFSQKRVIKWSIQICEVLSYLHSRQRPIIHSDIKPDNIMINSDDNICLIDFNVSMLFSDEVSSIGFTEGYSPPEQVSVFNIINRMNVFKNNKKEDRSMQDTKTNFMELNSGKVINDKNNEKMDNNLRKIRHRIDERSDIYSLGASMYHLIYGEKPENFNIDITDCDKNNIKINHNLKQIIDKAMSKDLEKRYKNIDEMLYDLRNIIA